MATAPVTKSHSAGASTKQHKARDSGTNCKQHVGRGRNRYRALKAQGEILGLGSSDTLG